VDGTNLPTAAGEATEVRTFLIADVRGYTRFTLEQGDEAAARLAGRFADLAEEAVAARGGQMIELRGDEILAVFSSARQALRAALELQVRCTREVELKPSLPLNVGVGLDAGEAVPIKGGYRGTALNLAARLVSLARPGEVLASEGVVHLARKTEGVRYLDQGPLSLKGFAEPVRVYRVVPADALDNALVDTAATKREAAGAGPGFQVRVLGSFELVRDGTAIDTRGWQPRVRSLFLLVATAPGRRRWRDEVIDLLWPDATPDSGSGNLRYTLHMLRRALGNLDPKPVALEQGWIVLNAAYRWGLDLERFEELASAHDDVDALEQAVSLYRGEPLTEARYDDWATPVRERAQRNWRDLCLRLTEACRAVGSQQEAAGWLERLLDSDPLDEEALRELLPLLVEMGRRTDALRRYQQFERRLREELDVGPAPESIALVERLREQLAEAPAFPQPVEAVPSTPSVAFIPSYPLPLIGPFVGRDADLARMTAPLPRLTGWPASTELPRDSPRLVLLGAEAGMGKTRLLAEAAQRAHDLDVLVLAGGCYEQEGRLPYGPIHDALADYLRAQPSLFLGRVRGLEQDLARIVPEIRSLVGDAIKATRRDTEAERIQLFLAVCQALERISEVNPLLLVLDDLHWADDATLQLLHFLLRQPGLERAFTIGAYRAEEVMRDTALTELTRDGSAGQRTERIVLQPLSQPDLGVLVEGRLGGACAPELVGALHTRSGGNPFFALQMVNLLWDERRLERPAVGWRLLEGTTVELPPAVRETIGRRLRYLGTDEREALTLGAILGRQFDYAPLSMLWQGEERTLFEVLDRAIDAHLLAETEEGYTFRHPLLWEVVYHRAPGPRRATLHERAALSLEEFYGDRTEAHAAELAHHFLQAGRVHLDRTVCYLVIAGDQAEKAFAHAEAEQHYRRALELLRQTQDATRAAEVAEKLGSVLRFVGRHDEALDLLEEAAHWCTSTGDLEAEGRVVVQIGWVYYFAQRYREGLVRLQPVVQKLEARGVSRSLALLYGPLPRLRGEVEGPPAEIEAAERAAELAHALGDDGLLAGAEMRRGRGLVDSGRLEEAIEAFEGAIALAERVNDLFVLTASYSFASMAYRRLGQLEKALIAAERGVDCGERRGGLDQLLGGGYGSVVELALLAGAWTKARTYAEHFLAIVQSHGNRSWLVQPLYWLGAVCFYEGAWEQAARYLEESGLVGRGSGKPTFLPEAEALLAQMALLDRDSVAALARLQPLRTRTGWERDIEIQIVLAETYLELGRLAEAEDMVNGALRRAMERRLLPRRVDVLRVQGMIVARRGRQAEAQSLLAEAASLAHPMPYPYGEARALFEWGRLLEE
jgi:DNA-binding SARP family transcriptional activator/class 3 adenylate cyclase